VDSYIAMLLQQQRLWNFLVDCTI